LICGVALEKRAVLRDMSATYVKTPLPTAVIDKSVFQRIAELPSKHRKATWDELHSHFQVVIPFVLVEEILVNRGNPEPIPPRVAETMFREVMKMDHWWIDDEPGSAFEELVEGKRTNLLKPVPNEFVQRAAGFSPRSPAYLEFLETRQQEAERLFEQRLKLQDEAAEWRMKQKFDGEEWFEENDHLYCLVPTEKAFFEKFVSPGFHARDKYDGLWYEMLNHSLGERMRSRFPRRAADIERALRGVTSKVLFECKMTFRIVAAKSFYFWAPLVRVGKSRRDNQTIIGRGKSAQRNNITDESYVAATLLCHTVLTRDKGMAKMADCFGRVGLWFGKPTYLPAQETDIQKQIMALP
jgi:hypothetical protein